MLKVGYIGLGLMGKSIARNILKAGFPLFVHNRSHAAVEELVAEGAVAASTPAVVAAQVDEAWKRFAALVEAHGGPAGFGADQRFHSLNGRNENRVEILDVVKAWVGARPVAEVLALLDGIDLPCAKVQRIDEVLADPQIQARGMLVEQDHPRYGKLRLPNLPFRFSDCDTTEPMRRVAPDLGQHNAQVAASLGFSREEIAAMQADGVLFDKQARPT